LFDAIGQSAESFGLHRRFLIVMPYALSYHYIV
jgi:hypothetical protein